MDQSTSQSVVDVPGGRPVTPPSAGMDQSTSQSVIDVRPVTPPSSDKVRDSSATASVMTADAPSGTMDITPLSGVLKTTSDSATGTKSSTEKKAVRIQQEVGFKDLPYGGGSLSPKKKTVFGKLRNALGRKRAPGGAEEDAPALSRKQRFFRGFRRLAGKPQVEYLPLTKDEDSSSENAGEKTKAKKRLSLFARIADKTLVVPAQTVRKRGSQLKKCIGWRVNRRKTQIIRFYNRVRSGELKESVVDFFSAEHRAQMADDFRYWRRERAEEIRYACGAPRRAFNEEIKEKHELGNKAARLRAFTACDKDLADLSFARQYLALDPVEGPDEKICAVTNFPLPAQRYLCFELQPWAMDSFSINMGFAPLFALFFRDFCKQASRGVPDEHRVSRRIGPLPFHVA